jgi:hypothetical protein
MTDLAGSNQTHDTSSSDTISSVRDQAGWALVSLIVFSVVFNSMISLGSSLRDVYFKVKKIIANKRKMEEK